jgi:Domain of unknown function (DUF4440)
LFQRYPRFGIAFAVLWPNGSNHFPLKKSRPEVRFDMDLEKYRALWHEDFVGWPLVNSEPVRKDCITDWMKGNTSRGLTLQSYAIEQLAIKVTADIAINHYRIKLNWARIDNGEAARTDGLRITHTWIRTGDTWQIIGGMSAPVNADGK